MIINGKDVGKQLITCNGKWDATKTYKRLCVVYKGGCSYLSKTAVPAGTSVVDEDYWQPFHDIDAAISIDLKEYKDKLKSDIDCLTEAVTTTVNSTANELNGNLKQVLARINTVEENSNSVLNSVLSQVSDLANTLDKKVKELNNTISTVDKESKTADIDLLDEVNQLKNIIENKLTEEVANLENRMAKLPVENEVKVETKKIAAFNFSEIEPTMPENIYLGVRIVVEKDVNRDTLGEILIKFLYPTTRKEESSTNLEDNINGLAIVGSEVYVKETKLTYIIDAISVTGDITYLLQMHSTIEADYFDEFEADDTETTVDRAIADEDGTNIRDNYIRKSDVVAYIDEILTKKFVEAMPTIYKGSITPEMLSEATKQLIGNKSVVNLPDDFTLAVTNDKRIGYADHESNPNNFRTYGHKHLRANIIDCKNILEQHLVDEDYTIYYVYLDYDLNGAIIELPENAVIFWRGGSFNNGTIRCRDGQLGHPKMTGTDLTVETI